MSKSQSKPPKPKPLHPRFDDISEALRSTSSWVLWRYALRGGKWTKPPVQPSGKAAKSNDPTTWSTFNTIRGAAPKFDGVGLVLVEDLVGVDLDHVLDRETGEVEAWASEVMQKFKGCYAERSPGGDGIRIFCRGKARRCGKGGPANRLELYDRTSPRYLTVTGHRLGEGDIVEAQAALDWLDGKWMQKKTTQKAAESPTGASNDVGDDEVLRLAAKARNGAKFNRLWSGDTGPDPSTADAALIGILAFWTQDFAQLDRLFRRSGLMRAKWDEKRGATTYGQRTIAAVLLKGGEHYTPPSGARTAGKQATAGGDWPDLDPLPEVAERKPSAFPFDGLGPTMGAAARDIADAVQAPDAIAAGSVLAAASLAAQPHHNVAMPHGAKAPLSVFVVTSALSGDRKTYTDNVACEPISARRDADHARYRRAKAAHDRAMSERKRGDPPPSDEPVQTSLFVSKATVEGILRLLQNQPHVGVFSNEGAEIFGGHSMREDRRTSGVAFLCKAWDGSTLDSITAGDGVRVLIGRRVCMHAMLQPVVLRPLLSDAIADGQGLLARCLIAQPESLAGTRLFPENMVPAHERTSIQTFHQRIAELVEQALPQAGDGTENQLMPSPLLMHAEARDLWIEFYNEAERQQATGGMLEGVRPWASKAAEQAARIAAIVAVVEGHSEVTRDDMACAAKVVNFYLGEHVRLMGASVEDRHLRRLTLLLEWMRQLGRPAKHKADILQRAPYSIRNLKAEGMNTLLDELARRGYIRRKGDEWEVRPDA